MQDQEKGDTLLKSSSDRRFLLHFPVVVALQNRAVRF
jgi:hypothetical protein